MSTLSRRGFLGFSIKASAGLILMPYLGCGSPSSTQEGVLDVPAEGYPLIEAMGSYRAIGRQIGSAMKERITSYLEFSRDYPKCQEYLKGEGKDRIGKMLNHARSHFPHLIDELEGMAESLDIPFMSLFAFNCRSEIDVITNPPGCSTIALKEDGRMILAHNEDGSDLNVGRMYLAKVTPPSGVTFLCFVYPGLLPGNGPGFNSSGVVQTTNYIQPRRVADGVPRYFISRSILEAKNLDEAVALATMKPRAFPWHHNFVSLPEQRILSVETVADPDFKHDVLEIEGLYIHTNHLIHTGMTGDEKTGPQPYDVPYISSTTRMEVLNWAIKSQRPPSNVEEIMKLLELHRGRPYSPCRHPEGDVHGSTLGTAIFGTSSKGMTLYHGNPCRRFKKEYVIDS